MRIIIKFFPEITIKSPSVRLYFIKVLHRNICNVLKSLCYIKRVKWYWDFIEISLDQNDSVSDIVAILTRVPGIHHILLVKKYFFTNVFDIFEKIFPIYCNRLIGKSFCVRVKRRGVHNFTSHDLECYLGDILCKNVKNTFIKLVASEEVINLEIKENYFFLIENRYKGLCGFPVGSQGEVLSLISGGFDSGISSYMFIRRGCKVHYCFFRFGGEHHKNEVSKLAYYLWKNFGCYRSVQFISVDFSLVLSEILEKISNAYMGIVLKRMMIRASSFIAKSLKISALVTGEALGQVSSQTLINLNLINNVSDIIIFRPLISYDKESIITLSREVGIDHFSINIPEYCGIISKKPTSKGSMWSIELEEKKFDFSVLNMSISERETIDISKLIVKNNCGLYDVKYISELHDKYVVIDIRTRNEQKVSPLLLVNNIVEVRNIPFYKLSNVFSTLDQSKIYLLYCGRGIMSRYHVLYLREQGFSNVNVYLPE